METKERKLTLKKSVVFQATPTQVWDMIVNPVQIKKYLFGTHAISDWKVGSPITFQGEWEGKSYEDKGTILKMEKEKLFQYNYWSNFSGEKDIPANYSNITYEISKKDGGTQFTLTQDNIKTEESRDHSDKNWTMVFDKMKEVLEK
jgi:uncharacterized protein YndB with AHSA1/START domain